MRRQGAETWRWCAAVTPGIYGMAGLMYETGAEYPDVEIEIVPGITAANGGAAVLGAPLMHDFAVISLSGPADAMGKDREEAEGGRHGGLCDLPV